MFTQQQPKFRPPTSSVIALVMPFSSLLAGAALAQQLPGQNASRHHYKQPPVKPNLPPLKKTTPLIESYSFNYQYANHPIVALAPTVESYLGSGFAPVGTYHPGQQITIVDNFGRPAGTYTIGAVSDTVTADAQQLNTVTLIEYD